MNLEPTEFSQKDLESKILEANQAYRDGKPFFSDIEYDCLEERLKTQYPDSELLKNGKISISQKQLRKRKLPIEMRSLDKVKSMEELKQWLEGKGINEDSSLILTPKYDGMSVVRDEETGEAWTSGDGFEGQICTSHLDQTIHKNLNSLHYSIGEVIIPVKLWKENFEGKLNLISKQPFKASRNTVSGLFNSDDPFLISGYLKRVQYIPYTLFTKDGELPNQSKERTLDCINFVGGENIIPYHVTCYEALTEKHLEELYSKWSENYKIDGIVVDINDGTARQELGYESNGNPAYSRAIKLPQWMEDVTSKVTGVERQVSKQGLIKPVVCIEPVQIGDVTVSRANGLNMNFINDWCIGEGDVVSLIRSGDVIPRLKSIRGIDIPYRENFSSDREYRLAYGVQLEKVFLPNLSLTSTCPCCGSDLEWTETGVDQICPNELCFDRVAKQLEYFFSTIGVTKVGPTTCEYLLSYVRDLILESYDFTDTLKLILDLSVHQLMAVESFGRESANGLFRQLMRIKSQGVPLAKLWDALGYFEGMGEKTLQLIINELKINSEAEVEAVYFETEIEVFDSTSLTMDRLLKISGISDISGNNFVIGLEKFYWDLFKKPIFKISLFAEEKPVNLNGQIVCCTDFRFSEEEKEYLHSLGYVTTDSFSKKTTILIAKDKSGNTGKLQKAREYGIQILNRSEIKILM